MWNVISLRYAIGEFSIALMWTQFDIKNKNQPQFKPFHFTYPSGPCHIEYIMRLRHNSIKIHGYYIYISTIPISRKKHPIFKHSHNLNLNPLTGKLKKIIKSRWDFLLQYNTCENIPNLNLYSFWSTCTAPKGRQLCDRINKTSLNSDLHFWNSHYKHFCC